MAKKVIKVDFGGVAKEIKSGGKAAHVPEGDYLAKPVSAELRKSEKSGARYFSWRFQIVKPVKFKGKTLYVNTSLKPDALWNLRNLIHAITGKNVAGKALNFDPEKLYGKVCGITVEDDEYEGKMKSQIADFFPESDFKDSSSDAAEDEDDDDSDDDEEEEVEEEDEEEDDDDLDEVDVDEL